MKKISRIVLVLLVAVLMTSVCTSALAEWTWNERVEIMVPAGEGGGLDTTIRKFSTYLSKALGTTITVQNKSGSVGVDGYVWAKNQTNNGFAFQFTAPSAILSDAQGLFPGFKLRDIKTIKSAPASTFPPSICHDVMGLDAIILVFLMVSFKPAFHLAFSFMKRFFSSSSFSAIRWYNLPDGDIICISEVIDISPSNLDSGLCFIQPGILHLYSA